MYSIFKFDPRVIRAFQENLDRKVREELENQDQKYVQF